MSSFKQMLNKEMAMANSSYARAAGIQSEISKVTVTRVASSEVECKRQTNLYHKDMVISVNSITREQRILRKTMARYSKRKHQHRLEKQKREKQRLEREQRERDELEKWERINSLLSGRISTVDRVNDAQTSENNRTHISDENNNEMKDKIIEQDETSEATDRNVQSLNPFELLPSIEGKEKEQTSDEENKIDDDIVPSTSVEEIPSTADTIISKDESAAQIYALTIRPLKPRKHIVSFSDIMKLKHSHNTDKLFDMVNILAQKHGVNESVEKRRTERRNSKIPKGSTDAVISESLRKAASVIYPMKFGYGDQVINTEPTDNNNEYITHDKNESRGTIGSKTTSVASTDLPKATKTRRNRSYRSDEMKDEDMSGNGFTADEKKFKNFSSNSSAGFLPSIKKSPSIPKHPRNNAVSWTEAFGLLKVVHNVQNIDEH